ncbi:ubiquitin-conjugating enzyme [Backusella circina FSU 941]|nr:ubiquitin-conjugating enzyme [Backusella circina FSU 941]
MNKRVLNEIKDIKNDKSINLDAYPLSEELNHLICSIPGPKDSPYEKGTFLVDYQFSNEHPFKPPKVKFLTKIYHPNISSQTGAICLSTLRDEWSPSNWLRQVLLSIQTLLSCPEPDDPQDAQVAAHHKRSYSGFENIAREWTSKYANKSLKEYIQTCQK